MNVSEKRDVIVAALSQCVPHSRAVKSGSWDFTLVNGKPFQVSARLETDWLVFETEPVETQGDWVSLLAHNQRLGASTKFVLPRRGDKPTLRSELLLCEETDLPRRVSVMRDQLVAAMGVLHGLAEKPDGDVQSGARDQVPITELCEQAGWPGAERAGSSVAVDLDVNQTFQQATVTRDEGGRLKLSCDLHPFSQPGEGERALLSIGKATSHLLLHVSGLLRLVRAEAVEIPGPQHESDPSFELRFTASLFDDVNARELHEAFVNLSLACELTVRESRALREARIADLYLQTLHSDLEA